MSKDILERDELTAIERTDKSIRDYLYDRCLPSPLKKGLYLLPYGLLQDVLRDLELKKATREVQVQEFMAVYARRREEAKKRLGPLFDPADYPSLENVEALFTFETRLMQFGAPDALRNISEDLYRQEWLKIQEVWNDAKNEVVGVLYQEMQELVGHISDRLQPNPDGSRRIFRNSMIERLQSWLSLVDQRNTTDNENLKDLVERARSLVADVSADDLRRSDDLRQRLGQEFEGLKQAIDEQVSTIGTRPIILDDDE